MTSLPPHAPAPPAAAEPANRRKAFLLWAGALLLIAAASLAAYAPVLHGPFLWDDLYLTGSNPFIRSPRFILEVFRHYLFLDSFSVYYRPVQNLSYLADYALWNRDPLGYHLTSILCHAAAAALLMGVLVRAFRRAGQEPGAAAALAFPVALLWAVHPIHNAAVAYVAGRADSLAMAGALAGWLLALRDGDVPWQRTLSLGAAALCWVAALCAKEIALTWLALFAVYTIAFERRRGRLDLAAILAMLLSAVAAYAWLRHLPGPRTAQAGVTYPAAADRLLLMLRALGDYTGLLFYPSNLHMERALWPAAPAAQALVYQSLGSWQQAGCGGEYLSLLGLATLAFFAFACASPLPGRPIRILGAAWFAIGFLPVSNLFPLNAQVAEHWIYMASTGYILVLAGFVPALPLPGRRALAAAVPLLVLALGIRTAFRAWDWAQPERLYRQTIASGGFPQRVSLNLADLLSAKGDLPGAESLLRQTLAQYPDYPPTRIQLGALLAREGRGTEAAACLSVTPAGADLLRATTPQSWRAALHLAGLKAAAHDRAAALAILDSAAARFPDVWELVEYRAGLLATWQGPAAATPAVAGFAAARWWHLPSHLLLAKLDAAQGQAGAAAALCADAASLDIHDPAPLELAARIHAAAGRFPDALDAAADAIERAPGQPGPYQTLAAILATAHREPEAAAAFHKAALLTPVPD